MNAVGEGVEPNQLGRRPAEQEAAAKRMAAAAVFLALALVGAAGSAALAQAQLNPSPAQRSRLAATLMGVPQAAVISTKTDLAVAIRRPGAPGPGALVIGSELQGEVVTQDGASSLNYKSFRSIVDVDCDRHLDRVTKMVVFERHNLSGVPRSVAVPGTWIHPSDGAYMADVVFSVCAWAPRRAAPPPASQTNEPRVAVAAPPHASAAVVSASAQPAPTVPVLALAAVTASPAGAVPPALDRPAQVIGSAAAQVGAFPTRREAQDRLSSLGSLPQGLGARIEAVVVRGRQYHRALVVGFARLEDARRFCAERQTTGAECWAH